MGEDVGSFGHRATDVVRLSQQIELAAGGLVEHDSGGLDRIHRLGFDVEHRRALLFGGCHVAAVMAATDFVVPAVEIIDSRYRDFKFDLKSVVADNTSASRFVVGGRAVDARSVDLRTTGLVLEKNGVPVALGAGAAVLGHPAAAVAMLVNHLGRRGKALPAGSLVLSGGATEAVAVQKGDHVTLRVQGMGSVSVRFV